MFQNSCSSLLAAFGMFRVWCKNQSFAPTSVEDVPVPEAEHLAGAVPLLQGRWQLRGRDVQINSHQGDADQTDMDPPLSHLERSDGGGLVIPASAGQTLRVWAGISQQVRTSTQQSATLAWLEAEVQLSLFKSETARGEVRPWKWTRHTHWHERRIHWPARAQGSRGAHFAKQRCKKKLTWLHLLGAWGRK